MTSLSPNEIRKKGIEALLEALGPIDMVRFMEQFDLGKGDYTKERKDWLDQQTFEEIIDEVKKGKDSK